MSALIHPTAVVDPGAEIGPDTRIWHFTHVSAGARIGARCTLGQGVFVAPRVRVGDGVKVQNGVSIFEGVEIDDDVFLGPSCAFTNVKTPRAAVSRRAEFAPTRVGRGATIGANATVVCGHDIGAYAMVGAGAVVTRDVPPHALVVGSPARRIGWSCRCGEPLEAGALVRCSRCGDTYSITAAACALQANADAAPVPFTDLAGDDAPVAGELRAAFERVLASGRFILGDEVARFEEEIAEHLGVAHAVGVSSGSDALIVALTALGVGPGDEVITTAYSFFATAGSIARLGAKPVFVDVVSSTMNLDPERVEGAITSKTKAIVGVHLFGLPFDAGVDEIARRRGVALVEDAAQAIGAAGVGQRGDVACFSFFPTKNLGALGDGGLVTTRDAAIAKRMIALRAHGAAARHRHDEVGGNFRLDALQAAFLRVKLRRLGAAIEGRRANAVRYAELFVDAPLEVPAQAPDHAWNQYVVRVGPRRDALRAHLSAQGVGTEVYYPSPLHLQPAFAALGFAPGDLPHAERAARDSLALPVFPSLGPARQLRVVDGITAFFRARAT